MALPLWVVTPRIRRRIYGVFAIGERPPADESRPASRAISGRYHMPSTRSQRGLVTSMGLVVLGLVVGVGLSSDRLHVCRDAY